MSNKFEFISRAIIRKDGKILVCKRRDKDYYFFPGGHVEIGETSKEALIREIEEERGSELNKLSFVGIIENIFQDEETMRYEINTIFEGEENNSNHDLFSKEGHLIFEFLSLAEFRKENVLPLKLRDKVLDWIKDGDIFWDSNRE